MSPQRILFILLLLALSGGHFEEVEAVPLPEDASRKLQVWIGSMERPPAILLGSRRTLLHEDLPRFYSEREYAPAWLDADGLLEEASQLVSIIRESSREGLAPQDYHLREIEDLLRLEGEYRLAGVLYDPHYMALLDLLLTDGFLRLSSHFMSGRVDPAQVHNGEWKARPRQGDVVRLLRFSLERGRIGGALRDMVPPHEGYLRLRDALERYRHLAGTGGWPHVMAGPPLHQGDQDERVPALRKRLLLEGDLNFFPASTESTLLDDRTVSALKRFQKRHGLKPDGVLGPDTLAELEVPLAARIRQIELNLERWRWLPKDLGSRHILVNIADYSLKLVEEGKVMMTMPVVVGTAYRRTPVFSSQMTYLEFAPYWGVPPTILEEDKLPLIRSDPAYLSKNHFEIVAFGKPPARLVDPLSIDWQKVTPENFPGVLRQKPGPWNALGRVKFMFPNEFDVYLHDSPERHLFARDQRSFSSGCIRIERPLDLAQYLLEGEGGWDCDRLQRAFDRREPLAVSLKRSWPVHLLYWTAWVDGAGKVQFRRDIYQRDADLDLALRKAAIPAEGTPPAYQAGKQLRLEG